MAASKTLPVVQQDDYLRPVEGVIARRHRAYIDTMQECCGGNLVEYANGYRYFGFQRTANGWWFREWLPAAMHVFIFGDFNDWERLSLPLKRNPNGVWEIFFDDNEYKDRIVNGTRYKLFIHGHNGWHERIDAYARYTIEDPDNHNFTAVVSYEPAGTCQPYRPHTEQPLIYECHIGMSSEKEAVASFDYFREHVLPRVQEAGYNTLQIMGIAEHPYYGSFGYHVSGFFAVSSRFGTIADFRRLVQAAHDRGINVVLDLVHAHFIKNLNEGLNQLDGSEAHYSKSGERGYNPHWDSMNFDYSKPEVRHFLLSNIKFWIEEFGIDGFRFDGVTAMIYYNHGYQKFLCREDYFNDNVNEDALCYLSLANKLIHTLNPKAITIAEDVSGMPTLCSPVEEGGIGFDYRLAMSVPDYWIEFFEQQDEAWDLTKLWDELNNRTPRTKSIGYCESHDQALVGDKTLALRLIGPGIYAKMDRADKDLAVARGIALHKMVRLMTAATAGNGYLNFMGNEFGHPDWIDFPRAGNNWSYRYARRQWSLADNGFLRYGQLGAFDKAFIELIKTHRLLDGSYGFVHQIDHENQTIVFSRKELLFVFNWHSNRSIPDYATSVAQHGKYRIVLNSDDPQFSGAGNNDDSCAYFTLERDGKPTLLFYNICRTALVFERVKED